MFKHPAPSAYHSARSSSASFRLIRRAASCAAAACGLISISAPAAHAQWNISQPVILQDFESSYLSIQNKMPDIFQSGYGGVYLPPPGFSTTTNSVGYDVYDRFNLGTANKPTTYGTQAELQAVINGIHAFGAKAYVDMLWNDSGSMNANTSGFAASGGYPGLAVTLQNTNPAAPGYNTQGYNQNGSSAASAYTDNGTTYHYYGDFHDPSEPSNGINGTVAGLDDIAQEENIQLIRQPTTAGDPRNIPAGTTPWNGYLANVPTASNAQYYPDLSSTPKVVHDTNLNQTFTVYQYNNANPMAGTAVPENAMGYLMRYDQYMIQRMGVDGFRIDAAINMPTWVLDYYDAAVYDESNRKLLNGAQEQIYGFSEVYDGNQSNVQNYVGLNDNNFGAGNTVESNHDVLDFPLYFAMSANLNAFNGGFGQSGGNNWNNVVHASMDYHDNGLIDGSEGVKFVNDQDGGIPAPGLVQVAYAYTLMLPGQAVVYYNGQNFNNESSKTATSGNFPEGGASDPKDAGMGALGGNYATNVQDSQYSNTPLPQLVDLRNRYGRGNYHQDWLEQNLYAFERQDSCLVLLSNTTDAGYDSRSFNVHFAPGTWLEEMTGNAQNSYSDPNGDIPKFVQVQDNGSGQGVVNVRFLRNKTYALGGGSTYATNDGFLIYALPTPTGSLTTGGTSGVIASQTNNTVTVPGNFEPAANYANGTQRNAAINVVTGSSFTLTLNTNEANLQVSPTQVYHDVNADGDNAQFTIDGGAITVAADGTTSTTPGSNGENTTPGNVSYGFQNFAVSNPGYNNAATNYTGNYSQTINTANLSIGFHYVEVISFRHNSDSTKPPLYSDWYDTIYVDRGTPSASIGSFAPFASAPNTYENRQLDITSDGTTSQEYVFLNLPVGITNAQIMNMITTGNQTINNVSYLGGLAGQIDQTTFAYGFNGIQNGNNVATIVSFRPDGNSSITRVTESQMPDLGHSTTNGLGLGDLDESGRFTNNDVLDFYNDVNSNGQAFNPSADLRGLGLNDPNDWLLFGNQLVQDNLLQSNSPYYVPSSVITYYQGLSPTISLSVAPSTSFTLNVPLSSAQLGALTMGAGATLNVTGTSTGSNTPYSASFGAAAVSGSATFSVSKNGTGQGTLSLGALNDGGTPTAIHLTGNGAINLAGTGNLSGSSSVTIDPGTTVTTTVSNSLGSNGVEINNNGTFNVYSTTTVGNIQSTGSFNIGNGSTNATLTMVPNSGTSDITSFTINGNSRLDISNNQIIVNYGAGSDPVTTIRQYLVHGANGGLWNGPAGIDSTAAQSNIGTYGVGYADAADPGNPAGLAQGTIEIQYALLGDANLDGIVNGVDFGIVAANFNKSVTAWDQGDFNYDGIVNGVDFSELAGNFNQGGGFSPADAAAWQELVNFAQLNGLMADVPEPTVAGLFAVNLTALALRRRRKERTC
jgi:hypothetical protein